MKECFICKTTQNLETHHVFYGTGNRKQSEKYGMVEMLCHFHHRDQRHGVHFNPDLDSHLKRIYQARFEESQPRIEFMRIFGRNYLE